MDFGVSDGKAPTKATKPINDSKSAFPSETPSSITTSKLIRFTEELEHKGTRVKGREYLEETNLLQIQLLTAGQ